MLNKESKTSYLWAPWRIEYILAQEPHSCPFCDLNTDDDKSRYILKRGEHSFIIMNTFPYNNGHLMICPYEHIGEYTELNKDIQHEMTLFIDESIRALRQAMNPDGFNVGMNIGRAAGAGIDTHCHWHIVPRWNGDTNFMPVTGHTKVISEALDATWEKLNVKFFSK